MLLDSTLEEMESTLRTIYEDHISLLRYLSLTGMPKPQALMLAAEFTLNADLRRELPGEPFDATESARLLAQVRADEIGLDAVSLSYAASQRMLRAIEGAAAASGKRTSGYRSGDSGCAAGIAV